MQDDPIFKDNNYRIISELVNKKTQKLRENKDFESKYLNFFEIMDILSENLKKKDKELFDKFVELYYQTEEYYLALAFSLGVKYGNELNKL